MLNIKNILTPTMRVKFDYYRDGCLWYSTINGFQFPIPINSLVKDKVIMSTGKASDFEYWIKKEFFSKKPVDNKIKNVILKP